MIRSNSLSGESDHSCRSATIGSTPAARRAGAYPARKATTSITPTAMAIVAGSVGFTPNSAEQTGRVAASAAARPTSMPTATSFMVSRTTMPTTFHRPAPGITYTYPAGTNNGKISSQTDAISGETVSYAYDSLNRLVSAQVPNTNLAQGKTATQSSTLSGYSTDGPSSAVDGNTDGNFFDGSVTHTNDDANAWWQVDLGSSQWVSTINIYGRTDCCSDRLSDYWVFVSDQPFLATDTPATLQNRAGTWNNHQTTYPNPSTAITVGAEGRYVRVQLSGTNYLSLAEVQVWGGWNQTFGYDAFGSLVSKTGSNSPPLSIGTNPVNNQVVGQNYDANGNQTSYNGTSLSYDSENHLLSAVGLTEYLYDSRGKRIWKGTLSGGSMTAQEVYFYGVDGQKLGTYTLGLAYSGSTVYLTNNNTNLAVFFGGKRVAVNGTAFAQDRLGSQGKYYPYGENRNALANDQVKFATYTRDSATSLDYADQRYYSNQFGRFMSPDRGGIRTANPSRPASLNRYTYTEGDPVNFADPHGLYLVDCVWDGGCANIKGNAGNYGGDWGSTSGGVTMAGVLSAGEAAAEALYDAEVSRAMAIAASSQNATPDPNCVQNAINAAAGALGLGQALGTFTNVSVQIAGTANSNGGTYGETELNLSGGDVQALINAMCAAGFYSNLQCATNNTVLVGSPHNISSGPNAGIPFTGNFRSPSLTNSVQVNTDVATGDVQIDVDPYNPAAYPILGLILHGVLQVMPNMLTGGDNTYGCHP
jgi:RHS repeat-associated protein